MKTRRNSSTGEDALYSVSIKVAENSRRKLKEVLADMRNMGMIENYLPEADFRAIEDITIRLAVALADMRDDARAASAYVA